LQKKKPTTTPYSDQSSDIGILARVPASSSQILLVLKKFQEKTGRTSKLRIITLPLRLLMTQGNQTIEPTAFDGDGGRGADSFQLRLNR
jgi:hypothetical protein